MLKITPIGQFLRSAKAVAKNHNSYNSGYPNFKFMQSCDFFDREGNYIGTMKRSSTKASMKNGSAYGSHQSYITTLENNGTISREQQINQYGSYAKIVGQNGEKDRFLPEKLTLEYSVRDDKNNIITEIWERVISSKLKPLPKEINKDYKVYEALEPVEFKENYLGKTITRPDGSVEKL